MVLIPEEGEEEEQEEQEGEGETSCGEPEWRDVEAEGRQWWGGFGAVYDQYCERMLCFDRMSIQPLIQSGMFLDQTTTLELSCLSEICSLLHYIALHFRS